jgi:CheY-like chemotaxis protein
MDLTTILHVEDDSNDVLLFRHACAKAGVRANVQVVGDGDEAMAYLSGEQDFRDRQAHPLPHLVLLDLKMPRVNGFELLSWMRLDPRFRRVPVVVLTSSAHEADVRRAYEAGANSYLVKPVEFTSLVGLARAVHDYWLRLNAHA